jgi:anti-sigma factor RsiW
MTPQFVLSHTVTAGNHLNEEQFGELLANPSAEIEAQSNQHLLTCDRCAAEFATIRESLSLFRDASHAYADTELRRLPQVAVPSRRLISPVLQPTWFLAAAAFILTAFLPMQMRHLQTSHSAAVASMPSSSADTAQSDEALLDDVDRESSASLPSPMQSLANPSTSVDSSTPLAVQRKD